MKIDWQNNKDFFAGLIFIAIGLTTMIIALRDFTMGTALNMGPGYLPRLMGGILSLLGLYIMIRGLLKGEKIAGVWGIRPIVTITLGITAFGFCIGRFGLIPSLVILLFIIALGGKEFKLMETLIMITVMIVSAWVIFIYGLGLPLRLFIWGN